MARESDQRGCTETRGDHYNKKEKMGWTRDEA